jgi:hypothetical protein
MKIAFVPGCASMLLAAAAPRHNAWADVNLMMREQTCTGGAADHWTSEAPWFCSCGAGTCRIWDDAETRGSLYASGCTLSSWQTAVYVFYGCSTNPYQS